MCPCTFLSSSDPPHFLSSPKIALYLQKAPSSKPFGPSVLEKAGYIRLSFRKGGQEEVSLSPCIRSLSQCIGMEGGSGIAKINAMSEIISEVVLEPKILSDF